MSVPAIISPLEAGIPADFLRRSAPELARDIVAQLDGAAKLAESYGLTAAQWEALRHTAAFRKLVAEAHTELSGPAGIAERARRKAALAVERFGIADMAGILADTKAGASARIAAFGELKAVAGLDKQQSAMTAPGTSGPLIVISIGGAQPVEIGGKIIEHES